MPTITLESALQAPEQEYHIAPAVLKKQPVYGFIKRGFDIVFSLFCLTVLLIPMAIIALLIRLDSPGPALFNQERLGKDGKPFIMYKFRSMHIGAEAKGPRWAGVNDDRCTRVGRILRKCRLDELPQAWNILNGTMSFVGPRPERACFYEQFETYIHGFSQRLAVKPGITGLAQVNGGYSIRPEEKIQHDIAYIKTRSLWLDFKILLKTVGIVLHHRDAK